MPKISKKPNKKNSPKSNKTASVEKKVNTYQNFKDLYSKRYRKIYV